MSNNAKYSSFKSQQLITEKFRRFINEDDQNEYDPYDHDRYGPEYDQAAARRAGSIADEEPYGAETNKGEGEINKRQKTIEDYTIEDYRKEIKGLEQELDSVPFGDPSESGVEKRIADTIVNMFKKIKDEELRMGVEDIVRDLLGSKYIPQP